MDKKLQRYEHVSFATAPDLVTPREACVLLRVGCSKIYDLIRSKQIPAYKLGRSYVIPRSALQVFAGGAENGA